MKGLKTTIRCVGATLVLGAVLATPVAQAGENGAETEIRNAWVYGSVIVSHRDAKMNAWASAKPNPNGVAAVMRIRLQHRACGSSKWTTKAFNASRGGFTNVGESAYTSEVSRTRGLWRASAVLAHKPRRGAPVDWQKRFRSPTWGDCRPLPPQP